MEKDWLKENLFNFLWDLSTMPQYCNGLALASDYSWNPYEGEPVTFEIGGWRIDRDSKDFEKAAKAAFENHLRDYIKRTAKQAKAGGYKLATGKIDLDAVKWLVLWNKYEFEYLAGIIQPIRDYCDVNVSVDTVRKAFKKFEKLDLPVRPFGKNRKNLTRKTGGNVSGVEK